MGTTTSVQVAAASVKGAQKDALAEASLMDTANVPATLE
jgi:hypothetical protein